MPRDERCWMSTESCLPVDGQPVRFAVVEGCCEDERDGVFHAAWSAAGPGARWAFVSDGGEPFRDQVVEWRGREAVAAAKRSHAARRGMADERVATL